MKRPHLKKLHALGSQLSDFMEKERLCKQEQQAMVTREDFRDRETLLYESLI